MPILLDPQKFKKNLEVAHNENSFLDYQKPGHYAFLEAALYKDVESIDFNSFTVEEAEFIIDAADSYAPDVDEAEMELEELWGNPIHEYQRNVDSCVYMRRPKEAVRVTDDDDDFI